MTKLYLNSNDLSDNKWTLDNPIKGKYKLIGFVCNNDIYNVNDNNNKVYVNESGDLTATLTNGYYDSTDFVSMLETQLNSVCSGTITCALDSNTHKLTISNTNNFYFTFATNTDNSARFLMGFNATDGTNQMTQTSDNCIDLNPYKDIFINISENDDRDIEGVNYFNTSLIINGDGNFGEIMRYIPKDNFDQYMKLSRQTKYITIKIHDSNNNDINLNSEYSIIFEKN